MKKYYIKYFKDEKKYFAMAKMKKKYKDKNGKKNKL